MNKNVSDNPYVKHGFDLPSFLRDYWQKKPCLIKQFLPNFIDPIDEHDLAGLAQESGVDSRLISYHASFDKNQWRVTQGPFDDFEPLCKGAWTLLVQGVERYMSEIDVMANKVKHIGHWRMDDVMVSFSAPNAGVGPHMDQYDVFIVQGKGQRRWQVGLPGTYESVRPHELISQIKAFTPVIDEVLQTGDAIYIPPRHPHNGIALSDCLNYSIGFRAPTDVELLNGLMDEVESMQLVQERYADPEIHQYRKDSTSPAEVTEHELARLKDRITDFLLSQDAENALMQSLSHQHLPDMKPEIPFEYSQVLDDMQQGVAFELAAGVKPIYSQKAQSDFTFFINGQVFTVESALKTPLGNIFNANPYMYELTELQQHALANVLTQLLNEGYMLEQER